MEAKKSKENNMRRDVIAIEYNWIIKRLEEALSIEDDKEFVGRFYEDNFIGEMWRTTPSDKREIASIIVNAVKKSYKDYLDKKREIEQREKLCAENEELLKQYNYAKTKEK